MRAHGIEVHAMLPVKFFHRNAARFDLRNHRKIAVIDGQHRLYTGSQNIVNPRFVKGYPNEELTVRATGVVVAQLQAIFLADHYFEAGGGRLDHPELFPEPAVASGESICASRPERAGLSTRERPGIDDHAALCGPRTRGDHHAPYFVPDEPFLQKRCAARRFAAWKWT